MMSPQKKVIALTSLGILLAATGCVGPLLVTPSTTPIENRPYQETGKTTGESCIQSILFIPFSTDASLTTALEDARLKVNADALIDVVVDVTSLYTFFYNKSCTVVHATGIRFSGQQAPFLQPGPAVPAVPGLPAEPPAKSPAIPNAKQPAPAEPAPAAHVKAPAKETRKQRRARLALEKRQREEERKKVEFEAQRKAEMEKKEKAEKEKAEQKKAEQEKAKALALRRAQENSKPVPGQFKIFCKFKTGDAIKVETKGSVIEGKFIRCVYFGVRLKKVDGQEGVIPFETIWTVRKSKPAAKTDEAAPKTPVPAKPKTPANPGTKSPAKPAKPNGSRAPAIPGGH
jgi:hypothetical protein